MWILQVFERGVSSIGLSVDLWLHFLKFTLSTASKQEEEEEEKDQVTTMRRFSSLTFS